MILIIIRSFHTNHANQVDMGRTCDVSSIEETRWRLDTKELRLLVDDLSDLIGSGTPLDGMSRTRALGLVIGLDRRLPAAQPRGLLDKLKRVVHGGGTCAGASGGRPELAGLAEQLRCQVYEWLGVDCASREITNA